jgi:hypothetical protein
LSKLGKDIEKLAPSQENLIIIFLSSWAKGNVELVSEEYDIKLFEKVTTVFIVAKKKRKSMLEDLREFIS